MSETPKEAEIVKSDVMIPHGFPAEVYEAIQKSLTKPNPQRSLSFQNEKQRNAAFIQKGLTKPGRISYETLRRAANSVHVARICITTLKEKITKTKWVVQPIDQMERKKSKDDKRIKEITALLKRPNSNSETFRTLLDKMLEDLLVLDAVSIEKTRFPDGTLAELHYVDSSTIRPVFDEYGNQDIEIPLKSEKEGMTTLPTSYVQILNNSQYGGPESGDIIAAWPKRDFMYFHQHPQGSMDGYGYGLSPLEGVLSVVSNLLNADNFNSTYFEEGAFPPIILQLVGQINQRDLEAYREYMIQELTGNFHRPAIMAGATKAEVINLKDQTNRDMQFMEYTQFLARLLAAAYGMSGQDIGLTDEVGSKNVSETQKDISEGKGYTSVLTLLKEVINEQVIADFGYDDLEFEWVAIDSTEPDIASQIYDKSLRNGTMTLNEVRQKLGETPYGEWADNPMILTGEGYVPLMVEDQEDDESVEEEEETVKKSVFTPGNYRTWADDRGYSQPFIFEEILSGNGNVVKPPVAVNLQSQQLEIDLTAKLAEMGLNVCPVIKMTYKEVEGMLPIDVLIEFQKYCAMTPEYDSEKWRSKFGGSRKYPYYLVSRYVSGYSLSSPLLLADMKRDPDSYKQAVKDLVKLWKTEKAMVLGDRRLDQYIITKDKRAYGIDYQFQGDHERWEKSKDVLVDLFKQIPELLIVFKAEKAKKEGVIKQIIKSVKSML